MWYNIMRSILSTPLPQAIWVSWPTRLEKSEVITNEEWPDQAGVESWKGREGVRKGREKVGKYFSKSLRWQGWRKGWQTLGKGAMASEVNYAAINPSPGSHCIAWFERVSPTLEVNGGEVKLMPSVTRRSLIKAVMEAVVEVGVEVDCLLLLFLTTLRSLTLWIKSSSSSNEFMSWLDRVFRKTLLPRWGLLLLLEAVPFWASCCIRCSGVSSTKHRCWGDFLPPCSNAVAPLFSPPPDDLLELDPSLLPPPKSAMSFHGMLDELPDAMPELPAETLSPQLSYSNSGLTVTDMGWSGLTEPLEILLMRCLSFSSNKYTHTAPCSRRTRTASKRKARWWGLATPMASKSSAPIFFTVSKSS